ncbi:hypothetical protein ALC57_05540 [Trachymyrmex cornetzi]|uniref:Uncharacterized protein n=1 Tax=Trachymyrmex cornetzi TaxID=471704 RepID=A0A151JAK3_9HYME|nr:hypothetical protein ALC57_05540 [Trachymyrmex cornetzi]
MDTRAKKGAKLSEDELETLRQALAKQEERLRNQGATLDRERLEIEKEREKERTRLQTEHTMRTEQFTANSDLLLSFKDEILRELNNLHRDVDKIKYQDPLFMPTDGQRQFEQHSQIFHHGDNSTESSRSPKISFREATESVPYFDGNNMPVSQFVRACGCAREIVPLSSERNLTQLLKNKLGGHAYCAVEDEPCETITQLIDLLNGAFGAAKTIDQYRGELSTIYIKRDEHMLDYIGRVKDLRFAILDAERHSRGILTPQVTAEINGLTARSFCDGLPLQYRLQMSPECHTSPHEAFATAKALAKREELDKQRYAPKSRPENLQGQTAVNPIRSPLAHSTPRRNDTHPERRSEWSRGTRDLPPSRVGNEGNSNYQRENRSFDRNAPTNYYPNDRPSKWCRYCKNAGHEIEQCRKREYNNSRANQGNARSPSGTTDEPRAGRTQENRPVRAIELQSDDTANGTSQP